MCRKDHRMRIPCRQQRKNSLHSSGFYDNRQPSTVPIWFFIQVDPYQLNLSMPCFLWLNSTTQRNQKLLTSSKSILLHNKNPILHCNERLLMSLWNLVVFIIKHRILNLFCWISQFSSKNTFALSYIYVSQKVTKRLFLQAYLPEVTASCNQVQSQYYYNPNTDINQLKNTMNHGGIIM